jgi:hypothetical protein
MQPSSHEEDTALPRAPDRDAHLDSYAPGFTSYFYMFASVMPHNICAAWVDHVYTMMLAGFWALIAGEDIRHDPDARHSAACMA